MVLNQHLLLVIFLAVGRLSARLPGSLAFCPQARYARSSASKKEQLRRTTALQPFSPVVRGADLVVARKSMAAEIVTVEMANGSGVVDWAPLVLSLLAGLSTCVGASVVFVARWWRSRTAAGKGKDVANSSPLISSGILCFSIAFAGSVMVTVSLFSLLPESFADEASSSSHQTFLLSPSTHEFWYRVASFVAGCGLCLFLSKAAFPEPEEILDWSPPSGADEEEEDKPLLHIQEHNILSREQKPARQTSIVKRQSSALVGADGSGNKAVRPAPASLAVARTNSNAADVESTQQLDVGSAPAVGSEPDRPRGASSGGRSGGWWSRFASGSDLATNEARRSWRVALLLFASLLAHNFPEGFAVAASSMHSPKLGVTTAVAIAFHNIPEGIAIAVPCLAARPDSPWLAFGLASLSGLAEPMGAFVALLVLRGFDLRSSGDPGSASSVLMDIESILSFVAGVMVTVACYELFPEARRHTRDGTGPFWLGIASGAAIMLASDAVLDATY